MERVGRDRLKFKSGRELQVSGGIVGLDVVMPSDNPFRSRVCDGYDGIVDDAANEAGDSDQELLTQEERVELAAFMAEAWLLWANPHLTVDDIVKVATSESA